MVNPDQIRTVIRAFRDNLPVIFPDRKEVPKTLIFAKTDSHADDIIQIVREEFGEGNDFCKKVTYKAEEDPKTTLSDFRNAYNPRIAVTVDMIATGHRRAAARMSACSCATCAPSNYFEQMKGRGTRTIDADDLKKVTPSAKAKTHYVIVDAVGVMKTVKTASRPLDTKPSIPFRDLAMGVVMGVRDDDTLSSLAARLARLDKQLRPGGAPADRGEGRARRSKTIVRDLFDAIDGDKIAAAATAATGEAEPDEAALAAAREKLVNAATKMFNGPLVDLLRNHSARPRTDHRPRNARHAAKRRVGGRQDGKCEGRSSRISPTG